LRYFNINIFENSNPQLDTGWKNLKNRKEKTFKE